MNNKEIIAVLGGLKRQLERDNKYSDYPNHIKLELKEQIEALNTAIQKFDAI